MTEEVEKIEAQQKVIQEASKLLYRDIKKNQDDFLYINGLWWKALESNKDNCTLYNKSEKLKYNHTRGMTAFLEWLFEGIEKGDIEIVEKK